MLDGYSVRRDRAAAPSNCSFGSASELHNAFCNHVDIGLDGFTHFIGNNSCRPIKFGPLTFQ